MTLPVGDEPVTVAIHLVEDPTTRDELVQLTTVTPFTVIVKLPLLPRLFESPT
jgi:hypothetical protein